MTDAFWTALAFVLILEGLMPLLAPSAWRRVFTQMLQLRDGQIRFCGLVSLLAGALVLAWMA
ncbi:MAG: DUF2065 family protein [Comamonas sp.]|jgi:uncharacterized protein YjeT (DUF2065 family)|nr:DUF2065 domain-containing protein [Comamonas sp.]